MNSVDMTQLLNRLRTMQAMAEGRAPEAQAPQQQVDFAAILKQTLNAVNETQQSATDLATRLETGDQQVSLEQVMIARQKASISFQAMMQTRNRLVTAYQEIMSMQF